MRVSHGIVFVDNGDGLPGADQVRYRQQNLQQATRLRSVEALTGWLLLRTKLPAAQRLAIYALPVDQRLDVLLPQLG